MIDGQPKKPKWGNWKRKKNNPGLPKTTVRHKRIANKMIDGGMTFAEAAISEGYGATSSRSKKALWPRVQEHIIAEYERRGLTNEALAAHGDRLLNLKKPMPIYEGGKLTQIIQADDGNTQVRAFEIIGRHKGFEPRAPLDGPIGPSVNIIVGFGVAGGGDGGGAIQIQVPEEATEAEKIARKEKA